MGNRRFGSIHGVHQVDLEGRAESVGRDAISKGAGIGDQNIDAAQLPRACLDPAGQGLAVADVDGLAERAPAALRQGRGFCRHRLGVAGTDRDVASLGDEPAGDRVADAARAAGHERLLAGQMQIHCHPPLFMCRRDERIGE